MLALDQRILHALYAGAWPPAWVTAVVAITFLGSGWMLIGLLPGLWHAPTRTRSAAALATLVVTSGAVSLLKWAMGRTRPCNALAWAHTLPIDVPSDPSFPSGHAAGSFAFVFFVLGLHPRVGLALFPLACLIALSRVALGVHYPSDVAAGAAIGAAFGWIAAFAYRTRAGAQS